ncbi:MAG: methyl-accepting chemotaxis protein [bacterium]|nr:methyl-accepting chemotaxis protein [bacterium]
MSLFKNMTISAKLMLSFAVIIILLVILALLPYVGMQRTYDGFVSYRSLARDTNLAGRLQANMLMVRMSVKDFLIRGDDKSVAGYEEYRGLMTRFLEEAHQEIKNPERAQKIDLITNQVGAYEKSFAEVVALRSQSEKLEHEVLDKIGPSARADMTEIMQSAFKDKDATSAYYAGRLQEHLMLGRLYVSKFIETREVAYAERANQEFADVKRNYEELGALLKNPRRRQLLEDFINKVKTYEATFAKMVEALDKHDRLVVNSLDKIGPAIAQAAEDVKLGIKEEQDILGPQVKDNTEMTLTGLIGLGSAAFLISVLIGVFLSKSIGGLTKLMSDLVNDLLGASEQVTSASGQISASAQQLSQGAAEQASSLEETSSTMEQVSSQASSNAESADHAAIGVAEMADLVTRSNENAQSAAQLASEARNSAEAGVESIGRITQAMAEINDASQQVADIIEVINDITHQTKMLATNAAIEAARAGEQGKGFAVVADEVSKLAETSKSSAKEISKLIKESGQKAQAGNQLAIEGQAVLQQIFEKAEGVARLIHQINEYSTQQSQGMKQVQGMVEDIKRASKEQANGVGQVSAAMSEMDKVTQSNAATAEESAAAAEELNSQAESLRSLIAEVGRHFGVNTAAGSKSKDEAPRVAKVIHHPAHPNHPSKSARVEQAPARRLASGDGRLVKPSQAIPMREDFGDF